MSSRLARWSRKQSPWVYHMNTGGCNGCDLEFVACMTPRYDMERFGFLLKASPRHADIILVTGPITKKSKNAFIDVMSKVPEPSVIVGLGACTASTGVYKGSEAVEGPLSKYADACVYVLGCPPSPREIMRGLMVAKQKLYEWDESKQKGYNHRTRNNRARLTSRMLKAAGEQGNLTLSSEKTRKLGARKTGGKKRV